MSTYRVIVPKDARKRIEKLPSEVKPRILQALKSLEDNPRPPGCLKMRDATT